MIKPDKIEERDELIPKSAKVILVPALKFGALTGPIGLFVGGIGGILRSSAPVLFALASGFQWFALGSTFYATRGIILRHHYLQSPTPEESVRASTVAGGITGASIGGLLRGRQNVLPGLVMFSLFGWAGQSIFNGLDARHTRRIHASISNLPAGLASETQSSNTRSAATQPSNFLEKIASMKYSPLKYIPDDEYEVMLQERLLRLDAEIALVDEKIEEMKQQLEKERIASDGSGEKTSNEERQR